MPVQAVTGAVTVQANHIYLLPPKKEVIIDNFQLSTYERPSNNALSLPINVFFHSLAKSWREKAVAIVLSGTGADGTLGISSIREHHGVVIAQLPESCRFDGMPQSAINTGLVDAVLRPEEMPKLLASIFENPSIMMDTRVKTELSMDKNISAIYDALNKQYKNDFQHYKPSTIMRRIHRRIALSSGQIGIEEYANILEDDKEELDQLYRDLLIGVTGFFRDPDAFEALKNKGVPEILDSLENENQEIRVWVCGCSTGEEAYSLAILMLEAVAQRGLPNPIKVFATDLHPGSLQAASDGLYDASKLEQMPKQLMEKYFTQFDHTSFKVTNALRKTVIFCEHNVLKNPPFTRMHLVACRNLLIYFKVAAQVSAITSFNFSLNHGSIMFLGASETPGDLNSDFETLDRHWKIYKKTRESHLREALRTSKMSGRLTSVETAKTRTDRSQSLGSLYNIILDKFTPAGVLLNEDGELLH
ncbi:MAG: CheR family methyltransferase, partial [Limnobacter sp.]|nr:CheR family methyltransferase [Limnobacter sp.]